MPPPRKLAITGDPIAMPRPAIQMRCGINFFMVHDQFTDASAVRKFNSRVNARAASRNSAGKFKSSAPMPIRRKTEVFVPNRRSRWRITGNQRHFISTPVTELTGIFIRVEGNLKNGTNRKLRQYSISIWFVAGFNMTTPRVMMGERASVLRF